MKVKALFVYISPFSFTKNTSMLFVPLFLSFLFFFSLMKSIAIIKACNYVIFGFSAVPR